MKYKIKSGSIEQMGLFVKVQFLLSMVYRRHERGVTVEDLRKDWLDVYFDIKGFDTALGWLVTLGLVEKR
ncbi:MAG: hypothetical protein WC325_10930 [Candidatus Bathyarchaeia archaeon]|jgi:hypothetical protein